MVFVARSQGEAGRDAAGCRVGARLLRPLGRRQASEKVAGAVLPGMLVSVITRPPPRKIAPMTIVDQFSGLLKYMQAGIDVARGKDDPAAQLLELRNRLQTASEQLLVLREAVSALQREKAEVEERLAECTHFEMERDQFEMVKLETGSLVYERQEPVKGGHDAPVHYCAQCFRNGKQSLLDMKDQHARHDRHECPRCGGVALIPHDRPTPRPVNLSGRRRRGPYGLS